MAVVLYKTETEDADVCNNSHMENKKMRHAGHTGNLWFLTKQILNIPESDTDNGDVLSDSECNHDAGGTVTRKTNADTSTTGYITLQHM
jgi:hypothetical protein